MAQNVIQIEPFQYVHVLDNNENITRLEEGPQTFVRKDHEKIVVGPLPMIRVPPRHFVKILNPAVRDAEGNLVTDAMALTQASGAITQSDGETYNITVDADVRVLILTPTGASWTSGVNRTFRVEAGKLKDVAANGVAQDDKTVAIP